MTAVASSISSAPTANNNLVELHIRVLGDWTAELRKIARAARPQGLPSMLIEGPYGAAW
jgi:hypothetical protein